MSYYDAGLDSFILMEEQTVNDGYGDPMTVWKDGMPIRMTVTGGDSKEAREAQSAGLKVVLTATLPINTPVKYGRYVRSAKDGAIYRITSNPGDKKTPDGAKYPSCYATCERTELPV